MGNDIEAYGFGEGTALSDGDDISLLHLEGGRAVHVDVLVAFLIAAVLGNVVEVVTADNNCVGHLGGEHQALEDSATDGNISCERALLVDIVFLGSGSRGLVAKTNALHIPHALPLLGPEHALLRHKDSILLLVSLFVLIALAVLVIQTHRSVLLIYKSGTAREVVCVRGTLKVEKAESVRHDVVGYIECFHADSRGLS